MLGDTRPYRGNLMLQQPEQRAAWENQTELSQEAQ